MTNNFLMDKFHVIAVISNPVRYKSRYELYKKFAQHMKEAGVKLWTVECAFGDRGFEITEKDNIQHLQVRTWDELWHKENMINLGIQHLSQICPDWQYVAWIDADVEFVRKDWVLETVHQLQHYMFVQMWENAIDLSPTGATLGVHHSFMSRYVHAGMTTATEDLLGYYSKWHPGYAWAARREALDHVGNLIDIGILGSGDRHIAGALIGQVQHTYNELVHPNYKKHLEDWQYRADRYIRRDVGFVPGTIIHGWHGKKKDRQYKDRWKILVENQYDPFLDLKRDVQGIYQLADHGDMRSLHLRDEIRSYFRSRNEDSIDLA